MKQNYPRVVESAPKLGTPVLYISLKLASEAWSGTPRNVAAVPQALTHSVHLPSRCEADVRAAGLVRKRPVFCLWHILYPSVQSLSRVRLFATPGLPGLHQLLEFTQTHVADAIQSSHPVSPPSPPALSLSQHQGIFQWVSSSHQVAKVLELQRQHQSFQWTPRTDLLQDGLVGSPCGPRSSQESSPTCTPICPLISYEVKVIIVIIRRLRVRGQETGDGSPVADTGWCCYCHP